jgi:hypothetical protein
MSSDKIPGVPEGWELVRIGKPEIGEWFIDGLGDLVQAIDDKHFHGCAIIRKIEKPARYRPFANAEEFKPHRDRWWYRDDKDGRRHFPPASYSDKAHGGSVWQHRFETCFFDDGTPFGVRIDE